MAQATHLTISTADRIRLDGRDGRVNGHDNEYDDKNEDRNDEDRNEIRQEVQVSVTYVLCHDDADLVKLAAEKAVEVKRVHEAVWHRIGTFSSGQTAPSCPFGSDCHGNSSPARSNGDGHRSNDDSQNAKESQNGAAATSCTNPAGVNGFNAAGGAYPLVNAGRADGSFPAVFSQGVGNEPTSVAPALSSSPLPPPEPASKPQKILIRSRAQKVGLSPAGLQEVVWKQYRHYSLDRLTKAQANAILLALDRYEQTGRIEAIEILPMKDTAKEQGPHGNSLPCAGSDRSSGMNGEPATIEVSDIPVYVVKDEDVWEPRDISAFS